MGLWPGHTFQPTLSGLSQSQLDSLSKIDEDTETYYLAPLEHLLPPGARFTT
jgi:hypothetical protein